MSRSVKKPWIKDNPGIMKRIHRRRYRRHIRQEVKQWRNRYYYNIFRDCCYCECMDYYDTEYWQWCAGLAFELEPGFAPRDKWLPAYDFCDWRFYCDELKYRRK